MIIEKGTEKGGYCSGAYFNAKIMYKDEFEALNLQSIHYEGEKDGVDSTLPSGNYTVYRVGERTIRASDQWFYVYEGNRPIEEIERIEESSTKAIIGQKLIDQFFAEWEADNVQWYWWIHRQYRDDYKKYMQDVRPKIGKTNHLIISQRQMLPRQGCGKSIQEIVSEDIEIKKAKLMQKIADKVGEVTEMNLYSGADGTPNGTVTGTKGTVSITTIVAGGYNIQCAHYRVLVK